MTAAKYDLEIDQGSSFSIALTVSDENGTKNLSTFNPRAQIRPSVDSPDSDATDFTFDTSQMASGIIIMKLEHDISEAMEPGYYVYDLEIYTGADDDETSVTRLMQGRVTISAEVTK